MRFFSQPFVYVDQAWATPPLSYLAPHYDYIFVEKRKQVVKFVTHTL